MRRIVTAVLVAAVVLTLTGTMLAGDAPDPAPRAQQTVDPLVRVLQAKGVLTAEEVQALATVPLTQQRDQLTAILLKKGVISSTDLQGASTLSNERLVSTYSSSADVRPAVMLETVQTAAPQAPAAPKPPAVIPAVAPIRVNPVDSPKRDGLVPALKLGPVKATPYGYIRMGVVEDSSDPLGIDFLLPGFLGVDTGPDAAPEFKVKARNTRLGGNFEWIDPSSKLTLTGKIEFDFEGNYTSVTNRGISSLRSSMPSLRLAFGRLDYAVSPSTTVYGVFGQDWVPFGSSTLPNTLEGTGVGIGFGSLYERGQQLKGGLVYKFAGSRTPKLLLEAAMVMPSSGNQPFPFPGSSQFQIPGSPAEPSANTTNATFTVAGCTPAVVGVPCTVTIPQIANNGLGLGTQLAIGERQGADSNRPSVEGRIALQFQLDKAPGVAPAQIILSGQHGKRSNIVQASNIPTLSAPVGGVAATVYKTAFPKGVKTESTTWGWNPQIQLPTRWFTLLGSYYAGGDLRWFFAGQVLSFYNDSSVARNPGSANLVTVAPIDGSSPVQLFTIGGVAQVVPQRPIRTRGGFLELGLPLSRLMNADPKGRNAGWTMNLHYGLDNVNANDLRGNSAAATRHRGDWAFANINYKLNNWVTFAFEESYYRTRALRATSAACTATPSLATCFPTTLFRGNPSQSWHDVREEFSTTFTF